MLQFLLLVWTACAISTVVLIVVGTKTGAMRPANVKWSTGVVMALILPLLALTWLVWPIPFVVSILEIDEVAKEKANERSIDRKRG